MLRIRIGCRVDCVLPQRTPMIVMLNGVCPVRETGVGLVLPEANTEAMNLHLAAISRKVSPGAFGVITLDGAGWHQTGGRLIVPENLALLHLRPYSPELNPVENVWQYLRQNFLSNRVFASYDAIVDACCDAWNALIALPQRIRTITPARLGTNGRLLGPLVSVRGVSSETDGLDRITIGLWLSATGSAAC